MSAGLIDYRIELVGGPYDASPGMRWRDDGERPPPELILLGRCPGDGLCGAAQSGVCSRQGRAHVYYWLADELERPTRVVAYELENSYVEPHADGVRLVPGRAVYTIGGLQLPAAPTERQMLGVGASAGGVTARHTESVLVLTDREAA